MSIATNCPPEFSPGLLRGRDVTSFCADPLRKLKTRAGARLTMPRPAGSVYLVPVRSAGAEERDATAI